MVDHQKYHHYSIAKVLFIAWGCSLLWGGGIFFSIMAFVVTIVIGLLSFFEPSTWNLLMIITVILGQTAAIISPILFSRIIICSTWKQSIKIGLGSFLTSVLTFFLAWRCYGVFYEWTHSGTGYIAYTSLLEPILQLLPMHIASCALIITVCLFSKTNQYHASKLVLGTVIAFGLFLINEVFLGGSLFDDNSIFHFIWQIPLFTWVSVIYFAELSIGRSKWTDFLVWVLLVAISLGLPFLIVPLFSFE